MSRLSIVALYVVGLYMKKRGNVRWMRNKRNPWNLKQENQNLRKMNAKYSRDWSDIKVSRVCAFAELCSIPGIPHLVPWAYQGSLSLSLISESTAGSKLPRTTYGASCEENVVDPGIIWKNSLHPADKLWLSSDLQS